MTETLRPIIFARYPHSGQCKTRLIPALGPDGAAALHRRLVERTLSRLAPLSPLVAYTGASEDKFRVWLGAHVELVPQPAGDLGDRLIAAAREGPALIIGSDIPDIDASSVAAAGRLLVEADLVLGPAEDGGFWLIGMKVAEPRLFADVAWGTERVFAQVCRNAQTLGYSVGNAVTRADLDRPEDLGRWPDLLPPR